MLHCRRLFPLLLLGVVVGGFVPAAPKVPLPPPAPTLPDEYDAVIRYRIQGFGNERLGRYFRLMEDLRLLGFQRAADDIPSQTEPEDSRVTRVRGRLTRRVVPQVLALTNVQAVLLMPAGKMMPEKEAAVRVNLRLASGLSVTQQQDLHAQSLRILSAAGFGEAVGYDTRGGTRILGQIPTGGLGVLLDDLRRNSAAWNLLPISMLGDLRKERNGTELVDRVIDEWSRNPAGRKLVLDAVKQWEISGAFVEYTKTLPVVATQNPTIFTELQIHHMARHPDSSELLSRLFEGVRKDAAGAELMEALLTRVEGAGLNSNLPIVFRVSPPVQVVEAQPQWPLPILAPAPVEIPKGQEKFTADLRTLVADAGEAAKVRRFEIVLATAPPDSNRRWADRFVTTPVTVEGRVGGIVTVHGPATAAVELAKLPDVVAVRLPRRAIEATNPARELKAETTSTPVCRANLAMVRQYADAGRLRSVVLIGADFRDWENHRGIGLPAGTRLLDLTAERNRDIQPDPYPGDPKETGLGTRAALALVRMAATTDLILVRVDPEAAWQVNYLAHLTAGEPETSLPLKARLRDLGEDRGELEARATRLTEERNRVLFDFRPEADKLRAEYTQKQAKFDADRKEFDNREKRYLAHERLTKAVRPMRMVWNTLTWDEGYPVFDTGPISRYLDDLPYPGGWLQSRGGDSRRVWSGLWTDADRSGGLDLLPADRPWPDGRWSPDLEFLAWTNERGETVADLPAGAVVRLAVQWKEAHDGDLALTGTDYFIDPLARIGLRVYRQLDPTGTKQPADDLAPVAQSTGSPVRLLKVPRFGVYEQVVEFATQAAGRYLLRVEGVPPDSTRPRNLPLIPAAREVGEMWPRVVVRTISGPGVAILENPTPERPALPMPADARRSVILGDR